LLLALQDQDSDPEVRLSVARAIGRISASRLAEVLPPVVDILQNPDRDMRQNALQTLKELVSGTFDTSDFPTGPPWLPIEDEPFQETAPFEAPGSPIGNLGHMPGDGKRSPETHEQRARAAAEIVPGLIKLLMTGERHLMEAAASALGIIGSATPEAVSECVHTAVSALMDAIKEDDPAVRRNAAAALGRIAPPSFDAVRDALIDMLGDSDAAVRRSGVSALQSMTSVPSARLKRSGRLNNFRGRVQPHAIEQREQSACTDSAVRMFTHALSHENANVRMTAATALGEFGEVAVPTLVHVLLEDADDHVKQSAATALGCLARPGDDDEEFRQRGKEREDGFYRAIDLAVSSLTEALCRHGSNVHVCRSVMEALGQLVPAAQVGPSTQNAILRLAEVLKLRDLGPTAIDALTQIGSDASQVLIDAYKFRRVIPEQRRRLVRTLGKMRTAAAIEPLRHALTIESLRPDAFDALNEMREYAALVLEPLLGALRNKEPHVRKRAAEVLGELGPGASGAVNVLAEVLRNRGENPEVRSSAATALGQIRTDAVAHLMDVLYDEEKLEIRCDAALALGEIGPGASQAAAELARLLDAPEPDLKNRAAESLARIGPRGIDALRERFNDFDLEGKLRVMKIVGGFRDTDEE
jgi:HEAT repeat protein